MKKRLIPGMFSSVPMAEVVTKMQLANSEASEAEVNEEPVAETDSTTE